MTALLYRKKITDKFCLRGELVSRYNLGNITYGYLGNAMGIGETTLLWGGGFGSILSKKEYHGNMYWDIVSGNINNMKNYSDNDGD